MELEVSPRHGGVTPSSVVVLSGLGGSGGNSLLERLWGSVLVWGHCPGELCGVPQTCPVPMLAPLPVLQSHLNGLFIRRWCPWIWLADPPSTFVTVLCSSGTCFVPILTLDSFLSLLSTLNLSLSD